MSPISIAIASTSLSPLIVLPVEKPVSPLTLPISKLKLENCELGYSALGVATVASLAFSTAALIPNSLRSFTAYAVLAVTGGFWAKEALSTVPNKEFSLAAKQLSLAILLLFPLGFYGFTLQRS